MKRAMTLLLAALLLCLSACGEATVAPTQPENTAAPTEATTEAPTEATTVPPTEAPTEPPEQGSTPALYRVEDENGAALYLLGSIHVTDSRAYPLPDYVMQAYEQCDFLAVECDINAFGEDIEAQTAMARKMVLTDGSKISDHISTETYEAAKAFLTEAGMYSPLYDSFKPAMWSSLVDSAMIELCGFDSEAGIDMHFLELAAKQGKEIREVESVEFQYDMLLSFPDALYSFQLADTLRDPQATMDGTIALYEFWLAGDEAGIVGLMQAEGELTEEEAALLAEYNDAMITRRNESMADTAETYLAQGGTGFFVVGAAHIFGEGGCVELLLARGYSVERIG